MIPSNFKKLIYPIVVGLLLPVAALADPIVIEVFGGGSDGGTVDGYVMTPFVVTDTGYVDCVNSPLSGQLCFEDHDGDPLAMHVSDPNWWTFNHGDVFVTGVPWVEIILPAGTQAFSWWTGVAFNTDSAWFQAFDDSGNDTGQQYFSVGPGYSEEDYVTVGFGVATGQCSAITSVIVEPEYWGVGNFSINQGPCVTVPEPAPLALFGIGLLAIALTRKIVRPARQS